MKQDIAKRWVAALRSKEYGQCAGKLRSRNKPGDFCCLGVLCNLHAIDHPEDAATQIDVGRYLGADICLPEQVRQWAGMETAFGRISLQDPNIDDLLGGADIGSLAKMNDAGVPFEQIADVIDEHWRDL